MFKTRAFLSLSIVSFLVGCSGGQEDTPADRHVARTKQALSANPELSLLAGALGGNGNVDGVGSEARFHYARGIAFDRAGNAYVADPYNDLIRKVVLATGEVTTLAGKRSQSRCSYDDGVGEAAGFCYPSDVAVDRAGNVYVVDSSASTIRKIVVSTREVTTIAGSPGQTGSADGSGADARFHYPSHLAIDNANNLYVADNYNHTIRKMVLSTGQVSTLAGVPGESGAVDGTGAAARFNAPHGLAVDTSGNLYVADSQNDTIRKIVLSTGQVSTFAGSAGSFGRIDGVGADARFYEPEGLVNVSGNLYVADRRNQAVRKIALSNATVSTLAGGFGGFDDYKDGVGLDALFGLLEGIGADASGNLYVSDFHHTIRKVVIASAQVTTLAGSPIQVGNADGVGGEARFRYNPNGMTSDGAGNVFVADRNNHSIRKVEMVTGRVTNFAGANAEFMHGSNDGVGADARFYDPEGITTDFAGNLFVADTWNNTIRKIMLDTGEVTTLAGSPEQPGAVDGVGPAARFNAPHGIVTDGAGFLYVADNSNHAIRKVNIATAEVSTFAGALGQYGFADGAGAAARFSYVQGLVSDFAGHLYVIDSSTVRKIDLQTAEVTTVAGSPNESGYVDGPGPQARFLGPAELTIDGAGQLYVSDTYNSAIRKIDPATGNVSTLTGAPGTRRVKLGLLPTSLNEPNAILALDDGSLAVMDENSLLRIK